MGEIADMMLDGTLCECCGVYLDPDETPPGFPQYCSIECAKARGAVPEQVAESVRHNECQYNHKEYPGAEFFCDEPATHWTVNDNRRRRYFCKHHAEKNFNAMKRKDRRLKRNTNPKMGEI
ncbi:MAG: hypothetical protein ACOCTU_07265 [Bacteroidota bacterium]